jgi:hypothetical protein
MFIVPIPRFRVDRLPNRTEYTQAAQIMTLNVVFSLSTQQPDGSGSGIELGQFVLFNRFPIARGSWVYWRGFEDSRGHAVGEGSVDDVTRMMILDLRRKTESMNTYV